MLVFCGGIDFILWRTSADFLADILDSNAKWLEQDDANNRGSNSWNIEYEAKKVVDKDKTHYIILGNGISYERISNGSNIVEEWKNGCDN